MPEVTVSIVDGPGKFKLMESCFTGRKISFEVEALPAEMGDLAGATLIPVIWIGVQAEDGSGDSWLVKFPYKNTPVRGWYRTGSKSPGMVGKGYLKFDIPDDKGAVYLLALNRNPGGPYLRVAYIDTITNDPIAFTPHFSDARWLTKEEIDANRDQIDLLDLGVVYKG